MLHLEKNTHIKTPTRLICINTIKTLKKKRPRDANKPVNVRFYVRLVRFNNKNKVYSNINAL